MPPDHLSVEWWEWFLSNNQNSIYFKSKYWLGVYNLRFLNGQPDEKYNYAIADHVTFFSTEGVEHLLELTFDAQMAKLQIEDEMHRAGYYTYFNSPLTMSIKRMHWHAIKWRTNSSNLPIKLH